MYHVAVASLDDLLLCGQWCLFVGAALLGLLLWSSTRGRWWVLAFALGVVSSAEAYTYTLRVKNTGPLPFRFNVEWAAMDSGWPQYPDIGGGTEVPTNSEVKVSESWTGAPRYAYALVAFYGGAVIGRSRGSATLTDYSKTVSFAVETAPVPPLPTNSVPANFPLGTTANNIGLVDYPNTSADGSWLWDAGAGAWIWDSNWTKSSFVPPTAPAGYRWEFGQRPGGHVMAPNDDMPEWFLMPDGQYVGNDGEILEPFDPSEFPDGDGVQGAGMERVDYWGRVNADGAARREELQRAFKISLDSTRSDMRSGFYETGTKLDDLIGGVSAVKSAIEGLSIDVPVVDGVTVESTFDSSDIDIDAFGAIDELDSASQAVVDGALSWESSLPGWCAGVGSWVFRPLFGQLPAIGSDSVGFSAVFSIPYVGTFPVVLDFAEWPWISTFRQVQLLFVLVAFTFAAAKCVQSSVL